MAFCTQCGASVEVGATFCTRCGLAIRPTSRVAPPQRRRTVGAFLLRAWRFVWPASHLSMRLELLLVLIYVTALIFVLRMIAQR